ncbi:MAG: hypothetical protein BWK80_57425 [Desulfobacteraceae bacterium IS3]|nr:MAG: hypothetical protein BWK80_57425 [Desulfobacteraceae bacterium IS3]
MNQNIERENKNIKKALDYAVKIIENYQFDIKNSKQFGVDLISLGFCQGEIYRNAVSDINRILNSFLDRHIPNT